MKVKKKNRLLLIVYHMIYAYRLGNTVVVYDDTIGDASGWLVTVDVFLASSSSEIVAPWGAFFLGA